MSAELLLPASSGPTTRALTYTFDTHQRYAPQIDRVRNIGITDTPDDWVPWFIYDLGLEDVIPYVRTFRRVLAEGPAWQATRGTETGIAIGIGWVESEGRVAPPDGRHNWWEFQVAFDRPANDMEQLRQLFGIINLSKASEDTVFRMFSPEFDLRPVRMDEHHYDEGLMDDYSGAPRWEGGPYISFGYDTTLIYDHEQVVIASIVLTLTRVSDWFEGMRFDQDQFEDRPDSIVRRWVEVDRNRIVLEADDTWGEDWQDKPWGETSGPHPFIARFTTRDQTVLFRYTDDEWQDEYQRDASWDEAVSGSTFTFPPEST